eukprot:743405-Prorocentrum_minimum.AAC.1
MQVDNLPLILLIECGPLIPPCPLDPPRSVWSERGEWTHERGEAEHSVGEEGFCSSDLESGAKYEAKATHYAPPGYYIELLNAGWNVQVYTTCTPHDTRAHDNRGESDSAPTQRLEVLRDEEELQVPKEDREELQKSL